jgi:hypothetical protein
MKHNTINEPFQHSLKLTYSIYKDSVASLQSKQCTPIQGHSQGGVLESGVSAAESKEQQNEYFSS